MAPDYEYRETDWLPPAGRQELFCKRLSVSGLRQMYRGYFILCTGNDCIFYLSAQCMGFSCAELSYVSRLVYTADRSKGVQ